MGVFRGGGEDGRLVILYPESLEDQTRVRSEAEAERSLGAGTGWGPRWYPHRPFPISQCL